MEGAVLETTIREKKLTKGFGDKKNGRLQRNGAPDRTKKT